jgi:hypothetical protein
MSINRKYPILLTGTVALVMALLLAISPLFVSAQDPTATPDPAASGGAVGAATGIACDSTLQLLLFLAERDYGFTSPATDVSTFDRGQFTPFSDFLLGMGIFEGVDATDEPTVEATAEAGDPTTTMPPDISGFTALLPGDITGEDISCTTLRAELEAFFVEEFNLWWLEGQEGGSQ